MADLRGRIAAAEELERRGELPADMSAALAELRRRGVVAPSSATPEPSTIERIGRGFTDVGQGAQQLYYGLTDDPREDELNRRIDEETRLYERGAGEGFDLPRLTGQALSVLPASLAAAPLAGGGLLGAAALGATEGALASGLLSVKEGESRAQNATMGALGGGVAGAAAAPAGRMLGRAVGWGGRKLGQGREVARGLLGGAPLPAAVAAADIPEVAVGGARRAVHDSIGAGVPIDPEAIARKARIEALGFEPTTGQVTRDPTQWAMERNLAKVEDVGAPLMSRFDTQRRALHSGADDLGRQFAPEPPEAVTAAEGLGDVVASRASSMQKEVGAAYDAADAAAGRATPVPRGRFAEEWRRLEDTFDVDAALPATVLRRVKEWFNPDVPRPMDVRQALDLDRVINENIATAGSAPSTTRTALLRTKAALWSALEELGQASGEAAPMYRAAAKKARERFQAITPKPVKELVEGTANLDTFVRGRVMGGQTADVTSLREFALASGEQGQRAWGGIQARVLNEIYRKAAPAGIDGGFSGHAWSKATAAIGKPRLAAIFGEEGADKIVEYGRVARDLTYDPDGAPVNRSNTAITAINEFMRAVRDGVMSIPGLSSWQVYQATRQQQRRLTNSLLGAPFTAEAAEAAGRQAGRRGQRGLMSAAPVAGLLTSGSAAP